MYMAHLSQLAPRSCPGGHAGAPVKKHSAFKRLTAKTREYCYSC